MCDKEKFEVLDHDDEIFYLGTTRPDDNGEPECQMIDVELKDFVSMFCLNYCSTTHKSQKETTDENFTIYDWDRIDTKCRYTARSRARRPEQVSFGIVVTRFQIDSFETNIKRKIQGHLKYDKHKSLILQLRKSSSYFISKMEMVRFAVVI